MVSDRAIQREPPKAVIHINFLPEVLLFDPRRIWTALRRGEERRELEVGTTERIQHALGQTAIHLAQRDYVLRKAVNVLKDALTSLANRIPASWSIPQTEFGGVRYRIVSGKEIFQDREMVLLAVDSSLFEFRAYLELLARFICGILKETGLTIPRHIKATSGKTVEILGKKGRLRTHGFLLYLCDTLSVDTNWYDFVVEHRNFFTHEGAPYIAIEDRLVRPPEFEFIIMRVNVHDFAKANPKDYFRLSEFLDVVRGIRKLGGAAQQHLVNMLEQ